ncbi:hypothetical protein EDD11_009461 [Mortierella claussenii]|nr:hypothetical protein EDD11_009461 [Mortierella claussenii]
MSLCSKDPLDWNIRVRGWAFSKRSNRRKRLVMSVARKIAGVTKDNSKVYETLESRFGMFLANNTHGAQFTIQCVGLASTTHMELAGDIETDDPTVDVLMGELQSADGALAVVDIIHDKESLRKSLEQDQDDFLETLVNEHGPQRQQHDINTEQGGNDYDAKSLAVVVPLQHAAVTALKSPSAERIRKALDYEVAEQRMQQQDAKQIQLLQPTSASEEEHREEGDDYGQDFNTSSDESTLSGENRPKYTRDNEIPLSRLSTVDNDSSFSGRLSKGAAILKGAIRKCRPGVMSQTSINASVDSLKSPSSPQSTQTSTRTTSSISDHSFYGAGKSHGFKRADSRDTALTQSMTLYEDLGQGRFPTIQTSSRPGGHFDGTLRMSHEEVEAHRRKDKIDVTIGGREGGHPRFLKLHAHHDEMKVPSHGVVNLIDPEGISIISDIDDTIKETNVTAGARTVLQNTFLKEMQEVEGMANVYRKWWNDGAAVHYVSNSPWQLIPSLLEFFRAHMFPPGSAHLRLHDSMLKTYFAAPGESKRRAIREILADFPARKFILVGDSGEIDMEIYTEMAIAYPNQIFQIFIRDITTARLKAMVSKLPPSRSLSLSSLLPPKSVMTTGFGLFGRRGSTVISTADGVYGTNSTSAPTTTTSSTSRLFPSMTAEEEDNLADPEIPITSSPAELSDEEPLSSPSIVPEKAPGHLLLPSLEPRSLLSAPVPIPVLESSATSSRSPPKHISAGVKAVTSSILGSAFKRSLSTISNTSNSNSYTEARRSSVAHGWDVIKSRVGSMSPSSPLAMAHSHHQHRGYPFPHVPSTTTSSNAASISTHDDDDEVQKEEEAEAGEEEPRQNNRDIYERPQGNAQEDIFDDHDHQHVVLQLQQLQHNPGKTRPRANTFSLSYASLLHGSTATATSSTAQTPPQSPPLLPKVPARGNLGANSNSQTLTTTLRTSMSDTSDATPTSATATAIKSISTTHRTMVMSVQASAATAAAVPLSTSPSMLSSSPTTPSSSSFTSIVRNPLEIWLERVEACQRRLPNGVELTLFESAETLEQCLNVIKMFDKYQKQDTRQQEKDEEEKEETGTDSLDDGAKELSSLSSLHLGLKSVLPLPLRPCAESMSTMKSADERMKGVHGADQQLIQAMMVAKV